MHSYITIYSYTIISTDKKLENFTIGNAKKFNIGNPNKFNKENPNRFNIGNPNKFNIGNPITQFNVSFSPTWNAQVSPNNILKVMPIRTTVQVRQKFVWIRNSKLRNLALNKFLRANNWATVRCIFELYLLR